MIDFKDILDRYIQQIEDVTDIDIVSLHEAYEPRPRQPWIRVTLLPSESGNVSQGRDSVIEHRGLFQIDIFTPKDTEVSYPIVNDVISKLNGQRFIGDLALDRTWRGVDALFDDWIRTPVFSRFRYYEYGVGVNDL